MRLVHIADRDDVRAIDAPGVAEQILPAAARTDAANPDAIVGSQNAPVRGGGDDGGADESPAVGALVRGIAGHDDLLPAHHSWYLSGEVPCIAERQSAMKMTKFLPILVFASLAMAAEVPSPDVQIAGAVLAAPAELRAGAAVLGYDAHGALVQIREGKNEMVCLATDPAKTDFNVACYHKDLEPFMARGRELLAQKVTGAKRNEIRFKEVEDGKVPHAERAPDTVRAHRHQL